MHELPLKSLPQLSSPGLLAPAFDRCGSSDRALLEMECGPRSPTPRLHAHHSGSTASLHGQAGRPGTSTLSPRRFAETDPGQGAHSKFS